MSWRDDSWNCGGPRKRRRDTPTPAATAATDPRASTGATERSRVRRCDESKSESKPAEVAALARFRQTERRRQDPDTETVSKTSKEAADPIPSEGNGEGVSFGRFQ